LIDNLTDDADIQFIIFLLELTYFDVDFTNVLWLLNVFCLKLIAYVYMMHLYGVCIIKVHCVSSHCVTISV